MAQTLALWAVATLVSAAPATFSGEPAFKPSPVTTLSPPEQNFYSKATWYQGLAIKAHASVPNEALFAARERLEVLLGHAPEVRLNLEAAHLELHVIGKWQFTSDLPEHRLSRGTHLDDGQLFDDHMRGGHIVGRFSSCTEGTLLKFVGDIRFGDETCLHELGHAVHHLALSSELKARITRQYQWASRAKLWSGLYAAKSEDEYFAELTKYYFTSDHQNEFVSPALGRGHDWLKAQDPEGYRLVDDLYSGRLSPGKLATRVALAPESAANEKTLRSLESTTSTELTFVNHLASPVRLLWLDFQGHRDTRTALEDARVIAPGNELTLQTFATHPWLVTTLDGTALCTVVAQRQEATVTIDHACP